MASHILIGVIFATSLLALVSSEPAPPKLLDLEGTNMRQIHILSEVSNSSGGYKLAEEMIDLDLGKAVYLETEGGVSTSWLMDVNEDAIYKYKPYSCERFNLHWLNSQYRADKPRQYDKSAKPHIQAIGDKSMALYGISAIVQNYSEIAEWEYSRTADLDGGQEHHSWALITDPKVPRTTQLLFSKDAGKDEPLQLNSIKILEASNTTSIKILSISQHISSEDRKKFELPLIYGCKRGRIVDNDMRQKFEIVSADQTNRYHLKTQARAISFGGASPTSTEPNSIELVMSNSNQATQKSLLLVHQQSSYGNLKAFVDYTHTVKFATNSTDGKCQISKILPSMGCQHTVLQFSNELNLTLEDLESMIYGVKPESYIKLEHHGQTQHAYFAQDFFGEFGRGREGRVVRKFSFDENNRSKLESFVIWVFAVGQDDVRTIEEVFEFDIIESKPLTGDADYAQAFDMSNECFIENEEMVNGRDYVWVSLVYKTDRVNELRSRVELLKNAFYQRMRVVSKVNFLRVPRMEIIFGESSFTLRMLVLDSLAPHLIDSRIESFMLDPLDIETRLPVKSLLECSELCKKHKCTAMTFPGPQPDICSVSTRETKQLRPFLGAVTYMSDSREPELKDLGLDQQAARMQPSSRNLAGILGIDEFDQSETIEPFNRLSNLGIRIQLDEQILDLIPDNLQIESGSQ